MVAINDGDCGHRRPVEIFGNRQGIRAPAPFTRRVFRSAIGIKLLGRALIRLVGSERHLIDHIDHGDKQSHNKDLACILELLFGIAANLAEHCRLEPETIPRIR